MLWELLLLFWAEPVVAIVTVELQTLVELVEIGDVMDSPLELVPVLWVRNVLVDVPDVT